MGGGERGTCHCVPMGMLNELLSIINEKATLLIVQRLLYMEQTDQDIRHVLTTIIHLHMTK